MSDDKRPQEPDENREEEPRGNSGMQTFFWIMLLLSIPLLLIFAKGDKSADRITEDQLLRLIREGHVKELTFVPEKGVSNLVEVIVKLDTKETPKDGKGDQAQSLRSAYIIDPSVVYKLLEQHPGITYNTKPRDTFLTDLLHILLPIVIIVAAFYFLFARQLKNAGRGAMQFGKSRARMFSPSAEKITFDDVAGIDEARGEVQEIVDFLRDPRKYCELGGRLPKGCLLVGPPGTGKTLLARAIAGEAGVPFFSMSGSDFVEMFVGVGASRVRDLFDQAKKHQPCILFIDEIDAVGRARNANGYGGGHDEREQTLNALLVEMDGFDNQKGVILIAATNRADVLDQALLRPGRFDRRITVNLPDVEGRLKILQVHSKKIKIDYTADLKIIAKGTPAFSGADLANLINEAALIAAALNKKAVTHADLEEARDKVRWGKERRSHKLSDLEIDNTAYHEAGHTIISMYCKHASKLHKVTIIPRGFYLGAAMYFPEEGRYTQTRGELIDQICVCMGGRIAEELIFGDYTNGAANDIKQATAIARKMVAEWGMGELGFINFEKDDSENPFRQDSNSQDTAQKIDHAVKRILDEQYTRAQTILRENHAGLVALATELRRRETLTAAEVRSILGLPPESEAPAPRGQILVQEPAHSNTEPAAPLPPPPDAELLPGS